MKEKNKINFEARERETVLAENSTKKGSAKRFLQCVLVLIAAFAVALSLFACDSTSNNTDESQTNVGGNTDNNETSGDNTDDNENTDIDEDENQPVVSEEEQKYANAIELLELGKYEESFELFKELGEYEDAALYASRFHYVTVEEEGYTMSGEEILPNYTYYYLFNENNQLVREVRYSTEGGHDYYDYFYDNRGNVIKEIETSCLWGSHSRVTREFIYDTNNNLVKTFTTNSDGSHSVVDYVFDDQGRVVKEIIIINSGSARYSYYTYDESGRLTKKIDENSNGKQTVYDYTYNENGDVLTETTTLPDGNVGTKTWTYDENNNLVKTEQGEVILSYYYDENNNLIKETYEDQYESNAVTKEYTYDENGNMIKYVESTSYGDYVYEYVYDDVGNLIKKTEVSPFGSTYVSEMTVELIYDPMA